MLSLHRLSFCWSTRVGEESGLMILPAVLLTIEPDDTSSGVLDDNDACGKNDWDDAKPSSPRIKCVSQGVFGAGSWEKHLSQLK